MKTTALSAGLALLLACSDSPEPAARPAPPDTAGMRVAAESADARDFAAARSERTAPLTPEAEGWTEGRTAVQLSAGSPAILRSVRQSRHEGFDRVVFDFGDGSMPNYDLEYVDKPQHECGSGAEVWLKGDAWLAIKLQPTQAHDDAGKPTVTERSRQPGLPNLLELRLTCDFEAVVEWIAGVAAPNGYRVMVLEQPTRLVVDLKH